MKKLAIILFLTSTFAFSSEYFENMFKVVDSRSNELKTSINIFNPDNEKLKDMYLDLNLQNKIDFDVFKTAVDGFKKVKKRKKNVLTIIDFSKPSTRKRFFVIDFDKNTVMYDTYVAHGKNSGSTVATTFSNKIDSNMSSLGFYLTGYTYQGSNGYSLRLYGLEREINDNAEARAIVIHGADYATESFLNANGILGRSLGCPAIPENISAEVIDELRGGTVVFIYGKDSEYTEKSAFIQRDESVKLASN